MYKGRPLIISKVPFFRKSFFGLNPFRWYSLKDALVDTDKELTTEGYYTVGDGGGGTFSWFKNEIKGDGITDDTVAIQQYLDNRGNKE